MHKGFDHEKLRDILTKRGDWVLSYNDSEAVRELYSNHEIVPVSWSYGMKNVNKKKMGKSSEILILSN